MFLSDYLFKPTLLLIPMKLEIGPYDAHLKPSF